MAFVKGKQTASGTWVKQESEATSTAGFTKSSQITGNVGEVVWDSGNTTWDVAVAPTGFRTIWDKDLRSTWVKGKQVT